MATRPEDVSVCIVVAAYNRSELLHSLVAGLKQQTRPFEACIVDNGSSDGTWEELGRWIDGDERFRRLRVEVNRGPAVARNLGWRSTDCEWIAFTDDDCIPDPQWLESLLETAYRSDATIVQGRTIPVDGWEDRGWWDRAQTLVSWTGRFETCNLLVSRDLLLSLDGFNEAFTIAMGEDTDLGLRATEVGAGTAFAEDAVVRHHIWRRNFWTFMKDRVRWAQIVALIRENPQSRSTFDWGFMWEKRHALVWIAVLATLAVPLTGLWWLPASVVLTLYGHRVWRPRKRNAPMAHRLGFSFLEVLATFWETACFAASAVRYRVFFI